MSNEKPQPSHPFAEDFSSLRQHYSGLLATHGDTPDAVQYRDVNSHEQRFKILAEVHPDLRTARVLDWGCGTGRLLTLLQKQFDFAGEYVGYDINPDMVAEAKRKFPGVHFEVRDILAEGMSESFDYILVNGVFNNHISDNWKFLNAATRILFNHTRRALAFNCLSTYVDYFDPGLYYVEPETVFRYCKEELSPCVTLRHDYMVKPGSVPFEFTVYVYRSDIPPRKARPAK